MLAAVDWLNGDGSQLTGNFLASSLLVRELENESRSADTHALLLSLLPPDDKFLTPERLNRYLQSAHAALRLEAVRALAQKTGEERFDLLTKVAQDDRRAEDVRLEAVMGLAGAVPSHKELLQHLADADSSSAVKREASRVLNLSKSDPNSKPTANDLPDWLTLLDAPGDAAAGRRLFFSSAGGRCSVCHIYNGRGGRIGPELTQVVRTTSKERILRSILQPSREIAPDYQAWILVTKDGKTKLGLRLPKPGDNGVEDYADFNGEKFSLPSESIDIRKASEKSIMPDGLEQIMSIDELRDLVTFLLTPVENN